MSNIVYIATSIDGYIATKNGNIEINANEMGEHEITTEDSTTPSTPAKIQQLTASEKNFMSKRFYELAT